MTNGDKLARARHLEEVSTAAKRHTLAELLNVTQNFQSDLTDLSDEFDTKINQVAAGDIFVLGTVSSVVEGAMWLEV